MVPSSSSHQNIARATPLDRHDYFNNGVCSKLIEFRNQLDEWDIPRLKR